MTLDLAKLRAETLALIDGTTPGQWHQANSSEIHDRSVRFGVQGERLGDTPMLIAEAYWPRADANARLIAAAPTLAADNLRLLDEIERLRGVLQEVIRISERQGNGVLYSDSFRGWATAFDDAVGIARAALTEGDPA